MKKKVLLVFCILIAIIIFCTAGLLLFGIFSSNGEVIPDSDADLIIINNQNVDIDAFFSGRNEVSQVATRYSILYKDANRRQMYVCSVPIRNVDDNNKYSLVNRDVVLEEENTYTTSNVDYNVTYSVDNIRIGNPDKWFQLNMNGAQNLSYVASYTNIYKDDNAGMCYFFDDDYKILVSPAYNGITITCEINNNQRVAIPVEFINMNPTNKPAGYIVIKDKRANGDMEGNNFVITRPIVSDEAGNVYFNNPITLIENKTGSRLIYDIPKEISGKVTLTFSLNYYCENMFFDCAAYENNNNVNYIFDSYVLFDSIASDSSTYNYMKFNIKSFTPKDAKLLDNVTLNLFAIHCTGEIDIEVYSVQHDWCSWLLTWKNKPKVNEKIGEFKVSAAGWYSIDLTQYVKLLINEEYYNLENNTIMFKIKDGCNGNVIFASTDNSVMPPFFEVNYRMK